MNLTVKIRRLDKDLPLPAYQTSGAVAQDLCARLDTTIPAHDFGKIPLNVALSIPEGYWGMLAVRSSTHKTKLIPGNGLGIMDRDFAGNDDEWQLVVYNVSEEAVTVTRGQRIAQLLILPQPTVAWEEVDNLGQPSRGAFGTTGTH